LRRKRAKIVENWVFCSFAPTSFSSQRAEIYLWDLGVTISLSRWSNEVKWHILSIYEHKEKSWEWIHWWPVESNFCWSFTEEYSGKANLDPAWMLLMITWESWASSECHVMWNFDVGHASTRVELALVFIIHLTFVHHQSLCGTMRKPCTKFEPSSLGFNSSHVK